MKNCIHKLRHSETIIKGILYIVLTVGQISHVLHTLFGSWKHLGFTSTHVTSPVRSNRHVPKPLGGAQS